MNLPPIGLDLRPLQTGPSTASGIGTYSYNLAKWLLLAAPTRQTTYLTLSNYEWKFPELLTSAVKSRTVFRPRKPERFHALYDYVLLRNLRIPEAKVFHLLQPSAFTVAGSQNVVTLHDLIPLRFPDVYLRSFDVRSIYRAKLGKLLQCDKIICVSTSVKNDAVELLKVDEARTVVIPEGVDEEFLSPLDEEAGLHFRQRFGIAKRYVLSTGGFDHRKNVISAVKAFLRCSDLHDDFQMVIIGKPEAAYSEVREEIERHGKARLFTIIGRLSTTDLVTAYQQATVFIYPSLYEGFGLPPLEAMAAGVPTITSNISSLPEVVGTAAIQVNPLDLDQLSHALRTLLEGSDIRMRLIREGRQRAESFTWQRTAEMTETVYSKLS